MILSEVSKLYIFRTIENLQIMRYLVEYFISPFVEIYIKYDNDLLCGYLTYPLDPHLPNVASSV